MQLDPAISALIGAVIGGVIGVIGTTITVWSASRRELKAYRRTKSQQHSDRIRETYEYALNVFFNLARDGSPDRATYGNMFAQLSLYGSREVKRILDNYLTAQTTDKHSIDLENLIQAMKKHLSEVEGIDV